ENVVIVLVLDCHPPSRLLNRRRQTRARLWRVARQRTRATRPRLHRQGGSLAADEAEPHRNTERSRGSESDHKSRRWQKPEVAIRNRTISPPGGSSRVNLSHDTGAVGSWPPGCADGQG